MVDVLFLLCGALCVVATIYKYRDLRRGSKNRPLGALTVGLGFLGAAFVTAAPGVYTFLNALLGVPNVMRLVAHVCIVAFACSIAQMLLHWAYPPELAAPRGRRRLVGYAAVLVLLVILFIAAPVDEEAVDWTVRYGHSPLVASYLIVYVLALGVATLKSPACRTATRGSSHLERCVPACASTPWAPASALPIACTRPPTWQGGRPVLTYPMGGRG